MSMKLSASGLKFLKREEGVVYKVYKDQVGLLTGGVGHLISKDEARALGLKLGDVLSSEQADKWLASDVSRFEDAVGSAPAQFRFDALVSFAFNVGGGAYTESVKPFALSGRWEEAAKKMSLYNKGTVAGVKQTLPVLVARRQRETRLLLSGLY